MGPNSSCIALEHHREREAKFMSAREVGGGPSVKP